MSSATSNQIEINVTRINNPEDVYNDSTRVELARVDVTRDEFLRLAAEAWDTVYGPKPSAEITITNRAGRAGVELKDALQRALNNRGGKL